MPPSQWHWELSAVISLVRTSHAALLAVTAAVLGAWAHAANAEEAWPLPLHLRDTGFFAAGTNEVDSRNLEFSPQYPLWSDGARKRRWIFLPPGSAIDASQPDAWEFPRGTRLWKEFAHEGRVETRFIERLSDGSWRFGAYVWNEAGTDATLAPAQGLTLERKDAPGGRYIVPAEADCRACHEGAASPVLGFSALQLSSDRDPLAPHAEMDATLDVRELLERRLIANSSSSTPARILARSPVERAALGYLHGNCAHCHNDNGSPVPVDLNLSQTTGSNPTDTDRVLRSMINARSRFRGHGLASDAPLVAPGEAERSVLLARMRSRNPNTQMPPLGTQLIDADAVALIERWIDEQSRTP
jgi:hypothetical protein